MKAAMIQWLSLVGLMFDRHAVSCPGKPDHETSTAPGENGNAVDAGPA